MYLRPVAAAWAQSSLLQSFSSDYYSKSNRGMVHTDGKAGGPEHRERNYHEFKRHFEVSNARAVMHSSRAGSTAGRGVGWAVTRVVGL